jgi:protein-disulfide isomerase
MKHLANGIVLFILASTALAAPQDDAVLRDIEELKQGQAELRRELAEIKELLAARRAPAAAGQNVRGLTFDLANNAVKGIPSASVTLVEFTDYQCPYCLRHARDTLPGILREYVDTGQVRYAVLDMPLEQIHPRAFAASVATECAAEQNQFWEMHNRLFANPGTFDSFAPHAEALGLDVTAFEQCIESGRHEDAVRRDMQEAQKAGLGSTPSFLLAATDPDNPSKVDGLSTLRGALPFNSFKARIDQALRDVAKAKALARQGELATQ